MTALVLAAVLGLAGCTAAAAATPASSAASGPVPLAITPASAAQKLSETGSSVMAPLFALWGPAYHAQFSQVNIGTASSSSGAGISAAAAGTTDIGASDAYLSPADVTKYASLVNIPLAVAALTVICHVPGAGAVHDTPGAIGYVGVSYLSAVTKDGEGEVALGNAAGNYVLPTASSIQAGLASFTNTPANETISLINGSGAGVYPIINYEYAVVSTAQASPTRAQDLRAFLTWAISTGTAQLAQVNFEPLPASVVMLSQAQIAEIKG